MALPPDPRHPHHVRRRRSRPPAVVHRLDDEASGLAAFIVLDDTTLGPAFGGIRMCSYRSSRQARDDAMGLARQMTLKCAFAGLPAGGGKAVVRVDGLLDRPRACAVLGDFIAALHGRFRTAGDLGVGEEDVRMIAARTRYIVDPARLGDLGDAAAVGLLSAMGALAPRIGSKGLADLRILVQGLGAIGAALVRRLCAAGCRPLVTDIDSRRLARFASACDVVPIDAAAATSTPVDLFAPCAIGGVIDRRVAASLQARAVVGGANRILAEPAAGRILWRRNILYAPDFVVSAGAVIRGAGEILHGSAVADEVIARIGDRVAMLMEAAFERDQPPEVVAEEMAWQCIAAGPR